MKICSIPPGQAIRNDVFLKTIDTALMQVNERFSAQQLVTIAFNILFPNRLAKGSNEKISNVSYNLLSLHRKILQKI